MKKIHIIATGGTIAGMGAEGSRSDYTAGKIKIENIIESIPTLSPEISLSCEQFSNLDSNDMTLQIWTDLSRHITDLAKHTDIDGFVITHGTDTMDEVSFLLSMTIDTEKPVVLTGSMRPATALGADGPVNIYDSIHAAADDSSQGRGVVVCFSSSIYSGLDLIKYSSFDINPFEGRNPSCLGYVQDRKCFYLTEARRPETRRLFDLTEVTVLPQVEILYYYAGESSRIIDYYEKTAAGLVVCGTGSGNYSQEWIDRISKLPVPVVRASRAAGGIITKTNRFDCFDNTIPAFRLSPPKARLLLTLSLTKTKDYEKLRQLFASI